MTIEINKNEQEVVMAVAGRLDTVTAPMLDKAIGELANDVNSLILDLTGLEYISSAGLRVILMAQKKMQAIGTMTLKNVREEIMDIFEMTGFVDILTIE